MKVTYQYSWLWLLGAILMMPLAYGQDETILVATFNNGNTLFLNSRVYLWNPSNADAPLIARVYTLQRSGPSTLVGTVDLGLLNLKSARNIKLAEDILQPLIDVGATIGDGSPLTLPYFADGGNLTLEFTIGANNVRGVAQVFTDNFAFGTYPLQGPESIGGTGPSGELPDGSVTTIKIADAAVTAAKIANGVVGSAQLADMVTFGASSSPGQINLVNSSNNATVILGNLTNEGILNVNDAGGNLKVVLQVTNNGGQVSLNNSTGNAIAVLGPLNNEGILNVNDAGGNLKVALQVTNNGGQVGLNNSTGNAIAILGPLNNEGALNLNDSGGNVKVALQVEANAGLLAIVNSTNNTTAFLGNLNNEGVLNLNDAAGNLKVFLGLFNNGGSLGLNNASNTLTAGIDGATGLVFGITKSFIVADPSDSNRMIKYTSVEGPEAAIYVRGTANLVSGQGHIEFPDHFSVMAVPSSITVSLTPRSASSMGLAAVSVSSQGIDVAELGGGTNSYSFDYVAYAVRKGFEDYEVYSSKEQASELTGQTSRMGKSLALPVGPKKALE